jgi:hypothetical protein
MSFCLSLFIQVIWICSSSAYFTCENNRNPLFVQTLGLPPPIFLWLFIFNIIELILQVTWTNECCCYSTLLAICYLTKEQERDPLCVLFLLIELALFLNVINLYINFHVCLSVIWYWCSTLAKFNVRLSWISNILVLHLIFDFGLVFNHMSFHIWWLSLAVPLPLIESG